MASGAARINQRLDAMFVKLGKIVVAVETVNEAASSMLSTEQLVNRAKVTTGDELRGGEAEDPADRAPDLRTSSG